MGLPAFLDFSSKIRLHATIVGMLFTLDTIVTLALGIALPVEGKHVPPELAPHMHVIKNFLIVAGVLNALFTLMYWVGFLKRQRWCLTVCIGFEAVAITLQFISLLGAMLQLNAVGFLGCLIALALNGYVLLVTLQLRKANSNLSVTQQGYV
uniref:Uncharacterized protein n=1 Tax=Anopheles epiroticus TaxID=199890 RepID=A0A182P1Y9_9DIPT